MNLNENKLSSVSLFKLHLFSLANNLFPATTPPNLDLHLKYDRPTVGWDQIAQIASLTRICFRDERELQHTTLWLLFKNHHLSVQKNDLDMTSTSMRFTCFAWCKESMLPWCVFTTATSHNVYVYCVTQSGYVHRPTFTRVQVRVHVPPRSLAGHQFVLEGRDPPADVGHGSCLHEESSLGQLEAAHRALSVVLLRQQQCQVAGPLQINVRTLSAHNHHLSVWF